MKAYYYLISSLPGLKQDEHAPITSDEFLSQCEQCLEYSKFKMLWNLSLIPEKSNPNTGYVIDKWYMWETSLRNRIVTLRTRDLNKEGEKYLRLPEEEFFSEVDAGIQDAWGQSNPLRREKCLDALRWSVLEDWDAENYFNFNNVCIYKIKLMLLEKWEHRTVENGKKNLDLISEKLSKQTSLGF